MVEREDLRVQVKPVFLTSLSTHLLPKGTKNLIFYIFQMLFGPF